MSRFAVQLLLASASLYGADRLYLKDGSYQLTNQYEIKPDRVRYYRTERGEWEEIPLEMVDMERTKGEVQERKAQVAAVTKAGAEERAEEQAASNQGANIQRGTGA